MFRKVYSFCYLEHTYTLTNPKCPPLSRRRPLVCMLKSVNIHVCCQYCQNMFFSMYARESLVILLLVTYILTDEPSNQKRVSSMYVQESLFILLLGTYIHTDQPKMSAPTMSTSVSMYVKTRSTYMYVVSVVSLE